MANNMTLLHTYCQEHGLQLPVYSTERNEGSSGGYTSSVLVCDTNYESVAIHSSKKLAEEDAARVAYRALRFGASSEPSSGSGNDSRRSTRLSAGYGYGYASPKNSSAVCDNTRRTGLADRPANSVSNGSGDGACYSRKLEQLCNSRGLPPPEYDVRESAGGKFRAAATVGGEVYESSECKSFTEAKDYASLVALAEISLSLLDINDREDGTDEVHISESSPSPSLLTAQLPERNYKAIINEYCQKHYQPLPVYATDFPDDSTGYVSVLSVCGKQYHSKPMPAKKKAEQDVAGRAALDLGLVMADEGGAQARSTANSSYNGSTNGLSSRTTNGDSPSSYFSSASSLGGGGAGGLRSMSSRFSARTAAVPETLTENFKGRLQEFLAKQGLSNPQYNTSQSNGGRFVSTVTLTDDVSREVMHFQGKAYANKKLAEQSAAKQACVHYNLDEM